MADRALYYEELDSDGITQKGLALVFGEDK